MYRQRVNQLVGEDATRGNVRRDFRGNAEVTGRCVVLQPRRGLLAARGGALGGNVMQRSVKFRKFGGAEIQNVRRQPPDAGSRFDQQKFFRPLEVLPHRRKFSRQQPPENRVHVHAGVVIGEALRFRFAVVAVYRMVEAFAHEIGKRDGAVAANAFGEQFFERRHAPFAPALPEASSFWSLLQARWKTSFASSSNSTKYTVSSEVESRKCSAASRSMTLAHSSRGNPAMPVPTAGKAMVFSPLSLAMRKQCAVELRSASAFVAPPSRMLAAWMTNRAFNFPPVVMAAYPTGMLPISLHSRWISSPPFRRMAPATPPPRIKSMFAALTIASVSISVRSPCSMMIRSASGFMAGSFCSLPCSLLSLAEYRYTRRIVISSLPAQGGSEGSAFVPGEEAADSSRQNRALGMTSYRAARAVSCDVLRRLWAANNHKRRGWFSGLGGPRPHIGAANCWAGIFRLACCEDIREFSAEHRGRPDRPARTDPSDDSGRVSALCRCLREWRCPLRAC